VDIELLATTAIKERLAFCEGLSPYINERDKEPSWDGNIYVYPNKDNKKAELIAKIPVQVKGKKKKISKKTSNLSFSIDISDLKNYLNDGGIIYFVVAIGDDKSRVIFYKSMLPFDLQRILKNTGRAKTKNINLHKLPDNEDTIRQVFLSFAADKKRQASQIVWSEKQAIEAVKNGATFKFHIQTKNIVKNQFDLIREATLQSFYIYAETKDGVEIPFHKIEESHAIEANTMINTPVFVGDKKYYDKIGFGFKNGESFITIGNAIKIPIAKEGETPSRHTFKYTITGTLSERIIDSDFILALSNCKQFRIGDLEKIDDVCIDRAEEIDRLHQLNEDLKMMKSTLDYYGVHTELNMDNLTDEEYYIINDLARSVDGNLINFNEKNLPNLFYSNKKIGNIVIRYKAIKDENSDGYRLSNAFADNSHVTVKFVCGNNGEERIINPWSLFLHMKADDFLCSNIEYFTILNSIQAMLPEDILLTLSISDTEQLGANNMLLEAIAAYDSQIKKDDVLLQFAIDIAAIIHGKTNEPVALINMLQAVKRQRPLTNDEIARLVDLRNMEKQTNIIKCAISILLGEAVNAKKHLDELSDAEKRQITDYPIYVLLESSNGNVFKGQPL
jgi:hypothetical protein